jgi:hypothetical protein
MSIPPTLMRLKIRNERHNINLWLPMFLGWLILLVLAIAFSPLAVILIIILWPSGWGKFILTAPFHIYRILCDLQDMEVDIKNEQETVLIYFR